MERTVFSVLSLSIAAYSFSLGQGEGKGSGTDRQSVQTDVNFQSTNVVCLLSCLCCLFPSMPEKREPRIVLCQGFSCLFRTLMGGINDSRAAAVHFSSACFSLRCTRLPDPAAGRNTAGAAVVCGSRTREYRPPNLVEGSKKKATSLNGTSRDARSLTA